MLCKTGSEINISILSQRTCAVSPTFCKVNKFAVTKERDVQVYNYWRKPSNGNAHLSLLHILASRSEVRGFDPGRGRWIFSERKNPEYDFLQKGSKAVGPLS